MKIFKTYITFTISDQYKYIINRMKQFSINALCQTYWMYKLPFRKQIIGTLQFTDHNLISFVMTNIQESDQNFQNKKHQQDSMRIEYQPSLLQSSIIIKNIILILYRLECPKSIEFAFSYFIYFLINHNVSRFHYFILCLVFILDDYFC